MRKRAPQEVVLFLTLEVVPKLTLERPKSGTKTNSPAYIYIYIYGSPLTIYRGLEPFGPENREKSEKVSRGLRPQGPPIDWKTIVWKTSRKNIFGTLSRLKNIFQTLETFWRLFPDSRGVPFSQRARGSKKFILARMHEKKKTIPHARNFHSRLKFSFSVWKFHSRLKISIPGPVFLRPERGPNEISFSIENFIPYWKLDFFNIASRDWNFSILGPSGFQTFSGFRAWRAQETPANGQRVPNYISLVCLVFCVSCCFRQPFLSHLVGGGLSFSSLRTPRNAAQQLILAERFGSAIWACRDSDLGEILAIWAPRFQITSDLRFVLWST